MATIAAPQHPNPIPEAERKAILDQEVERVLLQPNCRLEFRSDYRAIVVQGKSVNHILHLLLTIFTVGIWAIIWLCLALTGGEKRTTIEVDQAGRLRHKEL